jgi:hypothetical protein
MARKKQQQTAIPKFLILTCIITCVATLVLRILNRRLRIPELGEIAGYIGSAFVISLLIIAAIFVVNEVNKT